MKIKNTPIYTHMTHIISYVYNNILYLYKYPESQYRFQDVIFKNNI